MTKTIFYPIEDSIAHLEGFPTGIEITPGDVLVVDVHEKSGTSYKIETRGSSSVLPTFNTISGTFCTRRNQGYASHILKPDGTLYRQTEKLTDGDMIVLDNAQAYSPGNKDTSQFQQLLEQKYVKVKPLSPLDPRVPYKLYELDEALLPTKIYGKLACNEATIDITGGRKGTENEIADLIGKIKINYGTVEPFKYALDMGYHSN